MKIRFCAYIITLSVSTLILVSCATDGVSVVDKVMYDFGMGEKPEGYVSGTDRVWENMPQVGEVEIKRLNAEARRGEIKYQEETGLRGWYFKEIRIFERATPVDATAVTRTSHASGGQSSGYYGYISYSYRIMQSERKSNRTEAERAPATIDTGDTGQTRYRYRFTSSGTWDGSRGEQVR